MNLKLIHNYPSVNSELSYLQILQLVSIVTMMSIQVSVAAFEGFHIGSTKFLTDGSPWTNSEEPSKYRFTLNRTERYGLPELAINSVSFVGNNDIKYLPLIWSVNWQSSGDDVYRENIVSVGAGTQLFTPFPIRFTLSNDLYHININRYGEAITSGIGINIVAQLHPTVHGIVVMNGLLTGRLRNGHNDIDRSGYGAIAVQVTDQALLYGAVDVNRDQFIGLTLGIEESISDRFSGRILISETPRRLGFGVEMKFIPLVLTTVVMRDYPLGWSQQMKLMFRW